MNTYVSFIQRFDELPGSRKPSALQGLRHFTLSAAACSFQALGIEERMLAVPRIQILYIHHVFQDEETLLRALLSSLSESHTFISYGDAVQRIYAGIMPDRPYLAITSDDGFYCNMAAAKIFSEFGIRACFFVCPEMIGETDLEKVGRFCESRLHLPPVRFLDWSDLDVLRRQGHEIGNHTFGHLNCAKLSPDELKESINNARCALSKQLGPITHFAWPYGKFADFSLHAKKIVFESGHSSCASAVRGCHATSVPLDRQSVCIRRDHILLNWPLSHVRFFLANNARLLSKHNSGFPY